ncbi:hypothetical protein HYALB_00005226 [Hymenoscyphus albidus]|uniref:Uncharacterized protein n=1 Tax=Hymenoscyphus albidus TaxID=595503 RepID=A0A9N9LPD7_9HELO|nr:hypothetical protein HYALB_00005226 [Hymenoscyphus albidus]
MESEVKASDGDEKGGSKDADGIHSASEKSTDDEGDGYDGDDGYDGMSIHTDSSPESVAAEGDSAKTEDKPDIMTITQNEARSAVLETSGTETKNEEQERNEESILYGDNTSKSGKEESQENNHVKTANAPNQMVSNAHLTPTSTANTHEEPSALLSTKNDKLKKKDNLRCKTPYIITTYGRKVNYYPKYLRLSRPQLIRGMRKLTSKLPSDRQKEAHDVIYTLDVRCEEAGEDSGKSTARRPAGSGDGKAVGESGGASGVASITPLKRNRGESEGEETPKLTNEVEKYKTPRTETLLKGDEGDTDAEESDASETPVKIFKVKTYKIKDENGVTVTFIPSIVYDANICTLLKETRSRLTNLPSEKQKQFTIAYYTLQQKIKDLANPYKKSITYYGKTPTTRQEFLSAFSKEPISSREKRDKKPADSSSEEAIHPWMPTDKTWEIVKTFPAPGHPGILLRCFDQSSKSQPIYKPGADKGMFKSESSCKRLDRFCDRQEWLSRHSNYAYRGTTPFISSTRTPAELDYRKGWFKLRQGNKNQVAQIKVVVLNIFARLRKGFPVLSAEIELPYYSAGTSFASAEYANRYYRNEFFLPYVVQMGEVVGVWCWKSIQDKGGALKWFCDVAVPAFERHEEASMQRVLLSDLGCECCAFSA